jgi:hypothetical protein
MAELFTKPFNLVFQVDKSYFNVDLSAAVLAISAVLQLYRPEFSYISRLEHDIGR